MKTLRWLISIPLLILGLYALFTDALFFALCYIPLAFIVSPLFDFKAYWTRGFLAGATTGILIFLVNHPIAFEEDFLIFDPIGYLYCGGVCADLEGIIYLATLPLYCGIAGLIIGVAYKKFKFKS